MLSVFPRWIAFDLVVSMRFELCCLTVPQLQARDQANHAQAEAASLSSARDALSSELASIRGELSTAQVLYLLPQSLHWGASWLSAGSML